MSEPDFPEQWYEYVDERHFWMEWRFRAFARQLRDLGLGLGEPLKGLEVGCGTGTLCEQLETAAAWTLDGVDLHAGVLERHKPRRGKSFRYDVLEERKDLLGAYDFLVLFDVLEHLKEPGRVLKAAARHVKPGGYVFINVPALEALRGRYDEVVGHLRRYDKPMLRGALEEAGLETLDLRYWGLSLVPVVLLRTALASKDAKPEDIVRKGFEPPHPAVNAALRAWLRVETALLRRPPAGTSLLAAARLRK